LGQVPVSADTGIGSDPVAPPDRQAVTGDRERRRGARRRGGRGEQPMVHEASFDSYYGKPVLNKPTWSAPDIAGYLFLGGLAGASSTLGAGAQLTGRPQLARVASCGALVAISASAVALVHDLGRPARFFNMLRVLKPSSPMSVGSWLLAGYGPQAGLAAISSLTGWFPRLGGVASVGAGIAGPAVAAYTGVLISNTAVPAWHDGYREMPFVFVSSAATAAGGLGVLAVRRTEAAPARRALLAGAVAEIVTLHLMERRMGMTAEPYHRGRAGRLLKAASALTAAGGLVGGVLGSRWRSAALLGGLAGLAGSACTRFGIFYAGVASAEDPRYTVEPQRERAAAGPPAS